MISIVLLRFVVVEMLRSRRTLWSACPVSESEDSTGFTGRSTGYRHCRTGVARQRPAQTA